MNYKHGLREHQLYGVIASALSRCRDKNNRSYKHYGGRGIIVCKEWEKDKGTFIKWGISNGWKPGLEIDRIDNDGNYNPNNCRFVTFKENQNNKRPRSLKFISMETLKGIVLGIDNGEMLKDIAKKYKIDPSAISKIKRGLRYKIWVDLIRQNLHNDIN